MARMWGKVGGKRGTEDERWRKVECKMPGRLAIHCQNALKAKDGAKGIRPKRCNVLSGDVEPHNKKKITGKEREESVEKQREWGDELQTHMGE